MYAQLGTFSQPYFNRILSQIAFPITVLPKDGRTDSFREERLGLPYWTMIWAICVLVDESKSLDIPILEFKIVWEDPPFSPEYKQILRQLLVLRNQAVWIWYPWLLLVSCVRLMTLVQWVLQKALNRLLQYHLGVQLDLCIFGAFASNSACFKRHMSINEAKWTFSPFVLASSITSFILLTFVKFHAEIFSNFSHSLIHCCFCCGYLHGLRHRNKVVNQIVML